MDIAERLPPTVRSVVEEVQAENVPLLAASIAYNAFVSLLPFLLFLLVIVAAVGNETLSEQIIEWTEGILAPGVQGMLADSLQNAPARVSSSVVGIVTLLWGTFKIFRGLDAAFSAIYGTRSKDSFVDQIEDGLVVLGGLGFAVVAVTVAGTVFALFENLPFVGLLNPLLLVVGLSIAFFPVYYVFPDVDISAREAVPGAIVAAVGWAVLQSLFQVYVTLADKQEVYGVLGSVLLLLTWLYFSGLLLLVGGVVNAVLTGRTEGSEIDERADEGPSIGTDGDDPVSREEYEKLRKRYRRLQRDYADLEAELDTAHAGIERERD